MTSFYDTNIGFLTRKVLSRKFRLKQVPGIVELAEVSGSGLLQLEPRPSQWRSREVHTICICVPWTILPHQKDSPHLCFSDGQSRGPTPKALQESPGTQQKLVKI